MPLLKRLSDFIRYNNAFPIALSILFLGASGALAASPELRNDLSSGIVAAKESVVSIDNSYIASVNLSTYTPGIQITGVAEDSDSYYVAYTMTTIDLADGVWKDVPKQETMTVAKSAITGKDLGLYVTEQLAQVSAAELDRLKRTQAIEQHNGITKKTVATAYSGLIGRFLDSKQETLPGYTPVIPEPVKPAPTQGASEPETPSVAPGTVTSSVSSNTSGDTVPPGISILGNSASRIALHATYIDLGVVITDNIDHSLEASVTVDDIAVPSVSAISINTGTVGTHRISYTATDHAGNSSTVTRTVDVYDPFPTVSTDTASSTPTSTPSTSTLSTDTASSSSESGTVTDTTQDTTSTDASTTDATASSTPVQ